MKTLAGNLKKSTSLKITGSFVLLAIFASFILNLKFMQKTGVAIPYIDRFITSISLVCVSGLGAVSIGDSYNFLGQVFTLILIQIGGLGIITILNVSLYYFRKEISLRDQYLLQESLNRNTNEDFLAFLLSIYRFTITSELIGSSLLMISFGPRFGFWKGLFHSLYISVASFTNAGFHNFPGQSSLEAFQEDPLVLLTVSFLIILGGIGFSVWFEIRHRLLRFFKERPHSWRLAFHNLSTHTSIVLKVSSLLLLFGTFLTWAVEARNPLTLGRLPFAHQLTNAFFKAANARTAGFTSVNYMNLMPISKFVSMVQTLIGGAPGGTAGGIKVTTTAIIFLLFRAELSGADHVIVNKRTIPSSLIKRAIVILVFFVILLVSSYSLLLLTHPHLSALDLMFEVVNALGTAGISLNLTRQLSNFGHLILLVLMMAGRIGPITLLMGILYRQNREVHYAKTNIYLG